AWGRRRLVGAAVGLAVVTGGLGVQNHTSAFVLTSKGPVSGLLARQARRALDFDGDGAAPSLLGGEDCAAFDADVGPAARDVPGDGVDQDCRGGDAAPATAAFD